MGPILFLDSVRITLRNRDLHEEKDYSGKHYSALLDFLQLPLDLCEKLRPVTALKELHPGGKAVAGIVPFLTELNVVVDELLLSSLTESHALGDEVAPSLPPPCTVRFSPNSAKDFFWHEFFPHFVNVLDLSQSQN